MHISDFAIFSFVNKKKLRWNCSVEANHMKCNTLLQGWKSECYLLSTSKAGKASKSSNFHIFPVNGSGNCNEGEKKGYDIRHNGFISLADESDKTSDNTWANRIIFSLSRAHYSRATALERLMLQSSWWLILIRQWRSQYRKYFIHTCRSQVAKLPFRCHFQRDVQYLTWRSVAEKTKKAIDRNRCEMIRRNLLIAINVKWFLRKPLH
jgi:hypothetical protein